MIEGTASTRSPQQVLDDHEAMVGVVGVMDEVRHHHAVAHHTGATGVQEGALST